MDWIDFTWIEPRAKLFQQGTQKWVPVYPELQSPQNLLEMPTVKSVTAIRCDKFDGKFFVSRSIHIGILDTRKVIVILFFMISCAGRVVNADQTRKSKESVNAPESDMKGRKY